MKKYLSALSCLMALSIAGCSALPFDGSKASDSNKPSETEKDPEEKTGSKIKEGVVDIDDVIVVDNENCMIKITEIEFSEDWGSSLKTEIENRTSDKELAFSVEGLSVNGVQNDGFMYTTVAAGKKATDEISFEEEVLNENGITEYTDIEISFRVYNDDDWEEDDIFEGTVHVYPFGESKATKYVRKDDANDKVIFESDEAKVSVLKMGEDEFGAYRVTLYIENKLDEELTLSYNDAYVNDTKTNPAFWITLGAGKCTFEDMYWYDLSDDGIDEVEKIEFKLEGYTDLWDGYVIEENVLLEP